MAGKQTIVGQIVDCRVQMGTEWTEKLSAERHGVALQPVQGLSPIRRIGFAPNVTGAYHAVNQVSDCGVGDVHAFPQLARVQGSPAVSATMMCSKAWRSLCANRADAQSGALPDRTLLSFCADPPPIASLALLGLSARSERHAWPLARIPSQRFVAGVSATAGSTR